MCVCVCVCEQVFFLLIYLLCCILLLFLFFFLFCLTLHLQRSSLFCFVFLKKKKKTIVYFSSFCKPPPHLCIVSPDSLCQSFGLDHGGTGEKEYRLVFLIVPSNSKIVYFHLRMYPLDAFMVFIGCVRWGRTCK